MGDNNRLYDIRENLNLKQYEVAEMMGVNKRSYSFWETNLRFIPLSELNNFCNLFNVNMDYVFNLSDLNCECYKIEKLDKKLIGNNLGIICKENKITQKELASFLNTTQSTISAYINGKTLILTPFALQIARNYNISLDWLCGRSKCKYRLKD